MVIQGNALTLQLLLFGIPLVSTRQWARFPFSLGSSLRRPVRTNVMSTVGQEVSKGAGLVGGGPGVWTKPAEVAVDEAATVAAHVFGSGRTDEWW